MCWRVSPCWLCSEGGAVCGLVSGSGRCRLLLGDSGRSVMVTDV